MSFVVRPSFACTLPIAALLAMAALQPAQAVGPAASAASSASKQPLMSVAELQACVATRDRMRADSDKLALQHTGIDKDKAELSATIEAMNARAVTLDKKKKDDVDAFNTQSVEVNQKISELDARVAAFNKQADELRTQQEGYDRDCVSRSYDPRDLKPN